MSKVGNKFVGTDKDFEFKCSDKELKVRKRLVELAVQAFAESLSGSTCVKFDPKSKFTFAITLIGARYQHPIINVYDSSGCKVEVIVPGSNECIEPCMGEGPTYKEGDDYTSSCANALKFILDRIAAGDYLERT